MTPIDPDEHSQRLAAESLAAAVRIEDVRDAADPTFRRWRAEYARLAESARP